MPERPSTICHILIIAQYFPPDTAGTSTRAYNVVRGLRDKGCRITVLTAFPHYPHGKVPPLYKGKIYSLEQEEGIQIIRTWVPGISHYTHRNRVVLHASFIISSLIGLVKIRKIDLIISMNPSLLSFIPSFIYKTIFRKNIIVNLDDLWPEVWYELGIIKSRLAQRVFDWIAKSSYETAVAITPISYSYARVLTTKYHVPQEKIFVIEHGVDTDKFFRRSEGELYEARRRTFRASSRTENYEDNSRTNNVLIVYSGALSVGYDFEPVIKTAKLLEGHPVTFVLRGAPTSARDLENIHTLINQMNVKNVKVSTEKLSINDLVEFLNGADIFVLPMSFEGFDKGLPTKVLEYQAIGKPILCISNGEAADYVSRTKSGLVSRTTDPNKIAELVITLARDNKLAKLLGNNGYEFVQQNLTLEKIGERFMKIVQSACNKGNPNPV